MLSTEAAGSAEDGVMLVKESEKESSSVLGCVGPSGRPSDWLSASPSPGKLLDASKLERTAASVLLTPESVLLSPLGSALLLSGTWAKA